MKEYWDWEIMAYKQASVAVIYDLHSADWDGKRFTYDALFSI